MLPRDIDRISAELGVLREFIDFVNRQVGVYCDCLAGFEGNRVRVEHPVARISRPASSRIEDGQPIITWASVEDPSSPEVIHHRIIRADEFIATNSEAGFNEQQVCCSIIVFIFAFWDEEIRSGIAKIRGVDTNEVKVDVLGDLRLFRKSIIHNRGVIEAKDYAKLKVLSDVCKPNEKLTLTHDQMHAVFVAIKKAIGRLILDHTGHLPGAPKPDEIVDIAIQKRSRA
jgi:hypothetical protein